jgi:hypothetical protein
LFLLAHEFKDECLVEDRVRACIDCLGVVSRLQEADRDSQVFVLPRIHEVHHRFQLDHPHTHVPLVGIQVLLSAEDVGGLVPWLILLGSIGLAVAVTLRQGDGLADGQGLEYVIQDAFLLQFLNDCIPIEVAQTRVLCHC